VNTSLNYHYAVLFGQFHKGLTVNYQLHYDRTAWL